MMILKLKPPPVVTPQVRLEELLGRELARFLIASLSDSQGRRGRSSP